MSESWSEYARIAWEYQQEQPEESEEPEADRRWGEVEDACGD